MSMIRAGVFHGPRDFRVESRERPKTGLDGILVEVAACGICGTDMHVYRHGGHISPGMVIGHEFSGRIVEVGAQVRGLEKGMRVTVNPMINGIGNGPAPGAFADYVRVDRAVPGQNVYPLPEVLSDEEGALVEPFAVGLHAASRVDPKPTDRVAILGAGPIGLCTLAALRTYGIGDIVMTDVSPARLRLAAELGARQSFNVSTGELREFLISHFGESPIPFGRPAADVDLIVDCAGLPQTLTDAIDCVRFGGKVLVVAAHLGEIKLNPAALLTHEARIYGSWSYDREFERAIELLSQRVIDLRPLISHRFPLESLPRAFEVQANAAESVKVMVNVHSR